MHFKKVANPEGGSPYATIRMEEESDSRPVAVVTRVDWQGKIKEKRIKGTGRFDLRFIDTVAKSTLDRAILSLLRDGHAIQPPQEGPVAWMLYTEQGPPMGQHFVIDGDHIWVLDGEWVRRVNPDTGEVLSRSIGAAWVARSLVLGAEGKIIVLADGMTEMRLAIFVVSPDAVTCLIEVSFTRATLRQVGVSVGVTADGRILGPHANGFGLYSPDGQILGTFPALATTYCLPQAAISADGCTVATTAGDGRLLLSDVATHGNRTIQGPFGSVEHLELWPGQAIYVWEHSGAWGLYRMDSRGRSRILAERTAQPAVSADETLVAINERGHLSILEASTGRTLRSTPIVALSTWGCMRFASNELLLVRSDLGVLQGIHLPRLDVETGLEKLIV